MISILLCVNLTEKAITKIIEGNTFTNDIFHPQHIQALQSYEEAQKLWPFLQYNSSFTSKVIDIKARLEGLSKEPSVIIYLKGKIKNADLEPFIHTLSTIQGVKDVRYISQNDALSKYREKNKKDPLLLELVTADLFPISIEVYLTDQTVKNNIVTFAQSKTFVDRVFSREASYR